MAEVTEYFSYQGRAYVGKRNSNGSRAPAHWVYDASTMELAMTKDKETKNESWSGSRGRAASMATARSLTVNLTLGQMNTDNLVLATDGVAVDVAAGSVADLVIGAVVPGDVIALDHALISNLQLTTTGTPATPLVLDTDYAVDLDLGVITFLAAKTAVLGDYDYAAHSTVKLMEGENEEHYVVFVGQNTVDGSAKKVRAEVNRVTWNPADTLALINDTFGELPLTGDGLVDPVRQSDPKLGLYGRIITVDPS
ncbi:hypothetical protein KWH04_01165 [Xanthomonas campestris pv. trichodesmae]|uniref:Major tail protein n=2 Tax=Xanthomonas citri TaxID=346 RepID=A0AB33CDM6_XANCI|nr:hypothetical protein [Xanthomonas citri]ASK91051.1 hypothetical protein XcvCFBP7111P_05645 [Xanthomonas citri pv. vignicola]MBV6779280.1 hypothetical protein [Xanthomonas campestris pv. trichodesmae]MBZ3921794.1 hypothetical protein [Xanthomonas campestris pv. trichodesmae]MBZ3926394.1 hypothetical protein [Xanthomonas citri pv. sesbaniae]